MRYRRLGRTGVEVSEVGFGGAGAGLSNYITTWDPTQTEQSDLVEQAIARAIELGINYYDTAPLYRSEEMFGRALKPWRDQVFIATKAREKDADAVRRSVEGSMARLQTDHLDLIQYHGEWYSDELMHHFLKPGGILAGMQACRKDGLVRFLGFTAEGVSGHVSQLINTGEFDVMQIQYNLTFQHPCDPEKRHGVMYEAEAQNMGIAVMRPFTGGTFTKWINMVAPECGKHTDWSKALLAFVLSNPLTDVALVGMRSPQRVETNCAIVDDLGSRIDLDELYGRFVGAKASQRH